MHHRISFIVPTFNRAHFLKQALDSILAEAGGEDEVLVIDDGSSDHTGEVVAGFGAAVRYIRQENSGKSVALNLGMASTDGELVWICDDDDILLPGAASALLAPLRNDTVDMAFGRYYPFRIDEAGREERLEFHWPDLSRGSIARHTLEDAFIMQNAALVRRSLYDKVGPFDTGMLRSLDYEMFVRLVLAGQPVFVDREIFAQRKHEGARGPARMLHDANKSENVWLEFDQRIFRRLNEGRPIAIYEAMFTGSDAGLVTRAAYFERACVNARHGLWELAIADVVAASQVLPSTPMEPVERDICARALCGKYDLANVTDPAVIVGLRELAGRGGVAREAVMAIVGGGMWRFRRREGDDVRAMLGLILGVVGISGGLSLLLGKLRGRPVSQLVERDRLGSFFAPVA